MAIKKWMTRIINTAMCYPRAPRGMRNNNPLNIRFSEANEWQGIIGRDKEKGGMCVFANMYQGIRAAMLLINTYQRKYNRRTIRDIINRWAPTNENNTSGYIKRVCDYMKVEPDFIPHFGVQQEMYDCFRLILAMASVENGIDPCLYITDDELWQAYNEAFPRECATFAKEPKVTRWFNKDEYDGFDPSSTIRFHYKV